MLLSSGSAAAFWHAVVDWVYFPALARCSRLGLLVRFGTLCAFGSALSLWHAGLTWFFSCDLARCFSLGLLVVAGSLSPLGLLKVLTRCVNLGLLGAAGCSGSGVLPIYITPLGAGIPRHLCELLVFSSNAQ